MNRFTNIKIRGFRRLADVDLPMRPLGVVIGANGAGKSSLLDAISLLSASAQGKLNEKMSEWGGLNSILTAGTNDGLAFDVSLDVESCLVTHEYQLKVVPTEMAYEIKREILTLIPRKPKSDSTVDDNSNIDLLGDGHITRAKMFETALSQARPHYPNTEDVPRDLMGSTALYRPIDVSPRSPVRLPQSIKPIDSPGIKGEDLATFLYSLKESHLSSYRDRYEQIEETLRSAYPGFDGFGFPPVASGMVVMMWKDKQLNANFYTNQLSDGILRFIWLVSILQNPQLPALLMIDEPEISLHPELLSLLAALFREASERAQLIVATQSDRLVSFLKPEEVIVMDVDENGMTKATWADQLNVDWELWLKDYSMDEIWRMGGMGGRSSCESS
jgi:predicted ATPase